MKKIYTKKINSILVATINGWTPKFGEKCYFVLFSVDEKKCIVHKSVEKYGVWFCDTKKFLVCGVANKRRLAIEICDYLNK